MTLTTELLGRWLLDFWLLSTLLLVIAVLGRCCLGQPAARVALAWGTWLGIAALAILTALPAWPRLSLGELLSSPSVQTAIEPETYAEPLVFAEPHASTPEPIEYVSAISSEPLLSDIPASETLHWLQIAVLAWLFGSVAAIGWIVIGMARTWQLVRKSTSSPRWVQDELEKVTQAANRSPRLRLSDRIGSAAALGALRPHILLPEKSTVVTNRPAIRAALAHEWAHIRHGDLWALAIERMLLPLLLAHPLYWWLRRGVRIDQELLADAAAAGDDPVQYAEALLEWAKTAQGAQFGLVGLSMWERRRSLRHSSLTRRVHMILQPNRPAAPLSRTWSLMVVALPLPLVLGLSLLSVGPLTAQEETAAQEEAVPLAPAASEVSGNPLKTAAIVPVTQIPLDMILLSVNRPKLSEAKTTLEEMIKEATESRSRLQAGLVVADVSSGEVESLLVKLNEAKAVKVLSRPKIITTNGREARVQIGGEAPILEIEETINGSREHRIEYKDIGTMLLVRPTVDNIETPQSLKLDIVAELAAFLPDDGEKKEGGKLPGLVRNAFMFRTDVKLGRSLLVTQAAGRKGTLRPDDTEQFVLVITPGEVIQTVTEVYSNPQVAQRNPLSAQAAPPERSAASKKEKVQAAFDALAEESHARTQENQALREQVEQLQKELARLRGESTSASSPARREEVYTVVIRLTHRKAADVARDLKQDPKAADANAVADERANAVILTGPAPRIDELKKLVLALDQLPAFAPPPLPPVVPAPPGKAPAKPAAPFATRASADDLKDALKRTQAAMESNERRIERRLLELDLAEAELELQAAAEDFERVKQLADKALAPQSELRTRQREVERAKIQIQRIQVRLEASMSAEARQR